MFNEMNFTCPPPPGYKGKVQMGHGGGGRMSRKLIRELFIHEFKSPSLMEEHDGSIVAIDGVRLAFCTDGHVVSPPFFPGGDIGSLAVHGTVNDLAACGARPIAMSSAFVIEEGFPIADLERIVRSMAAAAEHAGVEIVTGDTKVVEHGKGDGVFITTSGIGLIEHEPAPAPRNVKPGDRVVISGPIARHGLAILSIRDNLTFESELVSDSAPLWDLVSRVYAAGIKPKCMRDPTRGGLAAALSEIAELAGTSITLDDRAIPLAEEAKNACEFLGLDPLFIANEGLMLFFVKADDEPLLLETLRSHPLGSQAAAIGRVDSGDAGILFIETELGGRRAIDIPAGEELPRIC